MLALVCGLERRVAIGGVEPSVALEACNKFQAQSRPACFAHDFIDAGSIGGAFAPGALDAGALAQASRGLGPSRCGSLRFNPLGMSRILFRSER